MGSKAYCCARSSLVQARFWRSQFCTEVARPARFEPTTSGRHAAIGWGMVSAAAYPVVSFGGRHLLACCRRGQPAHTLLRNAHFYVGFAFAPVSLERENFGFLTGRNRYYGAIENRD